MNLPQSNLHILVREYPMSDGNSTWNILLSGIGCGGIWLHPRTSGDALRLARALAKAIERFTGDTAEIC